MVIPSNWFQVLYSCDETGFDLECECSVPCHGANFAEEETVTFRKAGLRHCNINVRYSTSVKCSVRSKHKLQFMQTAR